MKIRVVYAIIGTHARGRPPLFRCHGTGNVLILSPSSTPGLPRPPRGSPTPLRRPPPQLVGAGLCSARSPRRRIRKSPGESVCTPKSVCRGRCLHRPTQLAPILRKFPANAQLPHGPMCTGKRQTHIRNAPSSRTAVTGIGPYRAPCKSAAARRTKEPPPGSWSGGVLTINFQGVGNSTATITVDYACTCPRNAVANGYLIYNVTVGDGGTTDPSGKPNAPTASNIGAFPDEGKAVLLHCVDAGARGHDATASSLNRVQNGYSVGEVVENPGTYYNVDGGKITTSTAS